MTNTVPTPLRANKLALGYDGRRGRAFSVRLDDVERTALAALHEKAKPEMGWRPHRTASLGAFIVWAAMQWKPAVQELPFDKPKAPRGRPKFPKPKRRRPTGLKGRRAAGHKKGRRS